MRQRVLASLALLPFVIAFTGCSADESVPDDMNMPGVGDEVVSLFTPGDDASLALAAKMGLEKVQTERPELVRGAGDLSIKRAFIDQQGEAHARLSQMVDNVPVFGAEAIVHMDRAGQFRAMTDALAKNIKVDTTPALAEFDARTAAYAVVDGVVSREIGTDLQVLPNRMRGASLTYRVQLEGTLNDGSPTMPVIFVDAHTGEILWQYDNLQTSRNRMTYTTNHKTSLPGTLVLSETSGSTSDTVLQEAHDYAGNTYDFYKNFLGRDSYNGSGATLKSTVHYSNNYVNAFWNGSQMVYGDGDGVNSSELTVLDVVGHELTHAVTEYSSGLVYSNESGALNEAMSDIFGATIEAYTRGSVSTNTWYIGEDCWLADTALRYMNDPARAGDFDYYPTRYTGTQDNGGVHWNSGIANLAFYLAVKGGTHPRGKTSNNVPALHSNALTSIQMGAAIFYRANTTCLTSTSGFSTASSTNGATGIRECTEQAANDLYGASAATAIGEAWTAVGVGTSGGGGGGGGGGGSTWTQIDQATGISVSRRKWKYYNEVAPSGASSLKITISGGSGDADLYVNTGSNPTANSYICRPFLTGNNEECVINNPGNGTFYIGIYGYSAVSGLTLTTSYQ